MATDSPFLSAFTVIVPFGGLKLSALPSKFLSTWIIRSLSPSTNMGEPWEIFKESLIPWGSPDLRFKTLKVLKRLPISNFFILARESSESNLEASAISLIKRSKRWISSKIMDISFCCFSGLLIFAAVSTALLSDVKGFLIS